MNTKSTHTALDKFSFEQHVVRVVLIEGAPWFSARDVAVALGYADAAQAYRSHCKSLKKLNSVEITELNFPDPHPRGEYLIPEADVYRLILRSAKPEAKRFEAWVMEEVLPALQRTGSYEMPKRTAAKQAKGPTAALLAREVAGAQKLAQLFGLKGNQALLAANLAVKRMYDVDAMKLIGADTGLVAETPDPHVTVTALGQMIADRTGAKALSAVALNRRLCELGYQERTDADCRWRPTAKGERYAVLLDSGKRHSDGQPIQNLHWKQSLVDELVALVNNQPAKGTLL